MQQLRLDERDMGAVIVSAAAGLAEEAYEQLLEASSFMAEKNHSSNWHLAKNYLAL